MPVEYPLTQLLQECTTRKLKQLLSLGRNSEDIQETYLCTM